MTKINKKHSFEYGAAILLITAILNKIIGALFKIPLSSESCLGDLGFGYFSAAYDLISPIILLSVAGLPVAVSKIISEYSDEQNGEINKIYIISRRVFLFIGIIATVLSLAIIFLFWLFGDGRVNVYCYLAIVPSFVFCCLSSAYRGYFEGITNMLPPAVSTFIESACKLILGYSFAYITVKITNNVILAAAFALLGITLGTVLSCIYLHITYKKKFIISALVQKNYNDSKILVKRIILIAAPIALYSFSGSVVGFIDSITVRPQLSGLFENNYSFFEKIYSFATVEQGINNTTLPTLLYGIRSKAYTLYNIIPSLTAYIGVSAVPHISNALALKNTQLVNKQCIKILKLSAVISFPAGIGFIALSREIMFLLFGENAASIIGGNMLMLFGIATAFSGVSVVMGNILQALGKQNKALFNVAIGVGLKIILNLILCGIKELNIYGSVISTAVCFVVIFSLNAASLFFELKKEKQIFTVFIKPLIASLLCGITAFGLSFIGNGKIITLISIILAAVIYAVFIAVLKVFNREEISELPFGDKILDVFSRPNA